MADRISTSPPRGMRDVLPDEVERRDVAVQRILAIYRSYGFRRIETPALESLRLLAGSGGGENEKLIFKVLRRGEDLDEALRAGAGDLADLGLRYDLTVPLARYYAENHARLPDPLKAIQIGAVWRADRPQKGRYRQFTQCDIDVLGTSSVVVEVELILATAEALRAAFGLSELTVRINDRRVLSLIAGHAGFAEDAQGEFFIVFDKLDKIGPVGVLAELREAGHDPAAVARFETLLPTLQKGEMSLAELRTALGVEGEAPAAFEWLEAIIHATNAEFPTGTRVRFDPTLVRGMGYYTGTIFEVSTPSFSSSVAGGGRYDRLIGRLLGREVPACGFSIGFERLIAVLGEQRAPAASRAEVTGERLALLVEGSGDLPAALAAARRLRGEGQLVSLEVKRKNLGKQLEDLATHGFSAWATCDGADPVVPKPLSARRPRP
jgi:histidyl-tRNA synthetase